jgi:hypothetical protein
MSGLEYRLATIGYCVTGRAAECWRVEQIGPPSANLVGRCAEPVHGHSFLRWLNRLSDRPQSTAYRISLASEIE